mgnify:CR=1 FL=1
MRLHGRNFVLTRALEQQSHARNLFIEQGARVLDLPALVIGPPSTWNPLDQALLALESFDWIVFSSANGVKSVESRLQKIGRSLKNCPPALQIAVVGTKTAEVLSSVGVQPDFVPPAFISDSLISNFPSAQSGSKILLPRVETGGREVLSKSFNVLGFNVIEVPAYESSCPNNMPEETIKYFLNKDVDAIVFTSGKTASHTAHLLSNNLGNKWSSQKNVDTNAEIIPLNSYQIDKNTCRDFTKTVNKGKKQVQERSTACRDENGNWKII